MSIRLKDKESIITVVGFLGAGKTTLLKRMVSYFTENDWEPYVILNDYENAYMDAQQFYDQLAPNYLKPLSGSCICCSGIVELRSFVNNIPARPKGVTIIEANGTSDACSLNGFLGVGLNDHFLPPVQVSVVDAKNWQKRGDYNELEANQIQVSSLIVLTHLESVSLERINAVIKDIKTHNALAKIIKLEDINYQLLPHLIPSNNKNRTLDHHKAHWSSCSVDLPLLANKECIHKLCETIPASIQRVKGCTLIEGEVQYTFFERSPDGQVNIRPFNGQSETGSKLLTIGPGSDIDLLNKIIEDCFGTINN